MSDVKSPFVIGLCGRSGSGKSFVSRLFELEGVPSVDTDAVYREMTSACKDGELSDCMKELVAAFGCDIVNEDGSLNRPALANIVFADGAGGKLAKLNEITHKHILAETDKRISLYGKEGRRAVIVDAPLLFESGYDKKCDFIVAASAPEELLVKRITERDGLDLNGALRRLKVQIKDEELRGRADFVIETDTDAEKLQLRIKDILDQMSVKIER